MTYRVEVGLNKYALFPSPLWVGKLNQQISGAPYFSEGVSNTRSAAQNRPGRETSPAH